jgi:DNA-directed RNA polymerase specialized sigma24 family protein
LINGTKEKSHLALLYHTSAKQLFNLALYAVGDGHLAEQAVVSAFAGAYRRLPDKSDVRLFERQCVRLLYVCGKKTLRQSGGRRDAIAADTTADGETSRLASLLSGLSFNERFILLLFCRLRLSVRQIAAAMRLPSSGLNAACSGMNSSHK